MEIRKAIKDDLYDLLELKLKLKNQDLKIDPYLKLIDEAKDIYKRYLLRDLNRLGIDRMIFVATDNGEIVGYIRGTLSKTLHVLNVKLRGVIDNLYIEEKARSKGIGKKLVEQIIIWFKDKGVDVVSLHVYPSNTEAINLYKKFGFTEYTINMSKKL